MSVVTPDGRRPMTDQPSLRDRAATFRAAADELDSVAWQFDPNTCDCGDCALCTWKEAARHLRRKADEAQQAKKAGR